MMDRLDRQVRSQVEPLGPLTNVVSVTHHPDVTLEEELRVRAALTKDGLFDATDTAVPPALPDEPAP